MNAIRMAVMGIRLVGRMKIALFFTFVFPVIFLFIYDGIFAHGNPAVVVYLFGPVLTLNIMGSGFWGLGMQAVMQRERGSLRRYRLAPISALTVVSSNLLANYLLQLPAVGLLVFCSMVLFHMPLKISLLALWFLVTVGTFAFAGFGLTIASVGNTMQEVQLYNNLVWMSLLFLSGVTVPLPVLPHWLQTVAIFLPATYMVSTFQDMMSGSHSLSNHIPELVVLVFSGLFGLLIAWKLFRWEKEERIPTANKMWALALVVPFLLTGTWMYLFKNPTAAWAKTYSLLDRPAASRTGSDKTAEKPLEDFEGPDAALELSSHWHLWAASGSTAGQLSLVSPGANGTRHALRFQGHLGGSDGMPFVEAHGTLTLPRTVGDLHGVEFAVRGDGVRRYYSVFLARTLSPEEAAPEIRFIPTTDWQTLRLPASLESPAPPSQGTHLIFMVRVQGAPGDFSVDIDEIKVY
jgi:ABC-2 type transport system permease protein